MPTTQPPVKESSPRPRHRSSSLCGGLLTTRDSSLLLQRGRGMSSVAHQVRTSGVSGLLLSLRIRDLQSPSREPMPTCPFSNTELPFGRPQILTAISSVYASTLQVGAAKTSFIFSLTQVSVLPAGGLWVWTRPDTRSFSPKEAIVDTFFMKRKTPWKSVCVLHSYLQRYETF